VKVEGVFTRGDVVAIRNGDGQIVARGLCNFGSADVDRIRGKKTADVRALLGPIAFDEVVHRDNLVLG
jgi:glutamate 5-kinase